MSQPVKTDSLRKFIAPVPLDSENIVRALTHRSFTAEHKSGRIGADNQRLEFLGDAILQWLSSEYLFKNFPNAGEGWMTQRRSVLVSREALYELALIIDLPLALRLGKHEERDGGRNRTSIVSDTMEAVVGAVYLHLDEEGIRKWAQRELYGFWAYRLKFVTSSNPKGELQEFLQNQGVELPSYQVVSEFGPDHARQYDVKVVLYGIEIGRGRGSSKKEAEFDAARAALRNLSVHNIIKK